MDESIRDSILKTKNAKDFLVAIEKKYEKLSKNQKNEYLNMLHNDKLMGCYHKLKAMGMDLGEGYMVWFVMGTLPSQFDLIISSYNAQKEQWSVQEMTVILAKEEDDTRKGMARSISMLTEQTNPQKRKFTPNIYSDQKPPKMIVLSTKGQGQG